MTNLFVRGGRLRPAWRVILYLIAFQVGGLLIQIPLVVGLGLYAAAAGLPEAFLPGTARPPSWILLASAGATLLSTVGITWFFRTRLDGGSLFSLGFVRKAGSLREFSAGTGVGFLAMGSIFVVSWIAGWVGSVRPGWTGQPAQPLLADLVLWTLIFGAVSLTEEMAFRGYVLQNLREGHGWRMAIFGSSLLFAVFHALNPGFGAGGLVGLVAAGLFLALGYRATGALWFPIGLHLAWNTAEGPIFGFPVSGLPTSSLLMLGQGGGDPLITGGSFGPEGGLLGIGAATVGGLGLWLWQARRHGSRDDLEDRSPWPPP